MLEMFLKNYKITANSVGGKEVPAQCSLADKHQSLIKQYGGLSFNNGLYRICSYNQVLSFTKEVENCFSGLRGKIQVFGYDWLGRLFALDNRIVENGDSEILLIEPGSGECFEIPSNIADFHNVELVDFANEALALQFHNQWVNAKQKSLSVFKKLNASKHLNIPFTRCLGYKRPLFLGGKDILENLKEIDIDVYISICFQLWNKTLSLKDGEGVGSVSLI